MSDEKKIGHLDSDDCGLQLVTPEVDKRIREIRRQLGLPNPPPTNPDSDGN